ncbi:hypothetical protein JDV02_006195 [Purpureocillium takamizusanense]|uniref:Integral membrane protein n=1 Tax=Purpureocillium takamizusanense TaxID=2060973 RepID=A0A9Q8QJR3_9HYPO|nr:uncharacterized protein JDV02_006195 [Purpureocillium takamizusanense]UNI20069.1 hypothetical protein JDV02_006195 [Purpureocillium takamizusanense]
MQQQASPSPPPTRLRRHAARGTRPGSTTTTKKPFPLQLQSLPPVLRPLVRAYILGFASSVLPRLLTVILQHLSRARAKNENCLPAEKDHRSFVDSVLHVLRIGLEPQRFPTFCAVLVGGATVLQEPLKRIVARCAAGLGETARLRTARWLASFFAAWLSLKLLQSKQQAPRKNSSAPFRPPKPTDDDAVAPHQGKLAGRTLDLTLFAATQAVDVIVGELWSRHRARRTAARTWTKAEQFLSQMIDPLSFVASCGLIMWAWFYAPDSLPRGYNKWITSAAHVDLRLIEALRRFKTKELRYREETGQTSLLGSMCEHYGLPYEWGDPTKFVPFPCDIVHMGRGPSCEYHAWRRFWLSWRWSMYTYLPLALALQLRKPTRSSPWLALKSACRSSAFLATYITLFYYGVCLGRTRVGPRLVGTDTACRNRIDGGICVGVGCFLCGWSVLIETASRRKDMALFVAPRAMATLLPRRYPLERQWRETLAFAVSTAVVFTCAAENPKRVRGMMGGILGLTLGQ